MDDAPFDSVDPVARGRHYSWPALPDAAERSVHAGLEALRCMALQAQCVAAGAQPRTVRLVTHLDVSRSDAERAAEVLSRLAAR